MSQAVVLARNRVCLPPLGWCRGDRRANGAAEWRGGGGGAEGLAGGEGRPQVDGWCCGVVLLPFAALSLAPRRQPAVTKSTSKQRSSRLLKPTKAPGDHQPPKDLPAALPAPQPSTLRRPGSVGAGAVPALAPRLGLCCAARRCAAPAAAAALAPLLSPPPPPPPPLLPHGGDRGRPRPRCRATKPTAQAEGPSPSSAVRAVAAGNRSRGLGQVAVSRRPRRPAAPRRERKHTVMAPSDGVFCAITGASHGQSETSPA